MHKVPELGRPGTTVAHEQQARCMRACCVEPVSVSSCFPSGTCKPCSGPLSTHAPSFAGTAPVVVISAAIASLTRRGSVWAWTIQAQVFSNSLPVQGQQQPAEHATTLAAETVREVISGAQGVRERSAWRSGASWLLGHSRISLLSSTSERAGGPVRNVAAT